MDKLVLIVKEFEMQNKELGAPIDENVLYIKGYANRYLDNSGQLVIDRSGDSVLPYGYNLENFMKNPILLSYHDKQEPVGKIIDIKISTDGLEITAEVHKLLNPKVFYAVQNKILKTFSIGFKPLDAQYDPHIDVYYYKAVELLEVSIVSVPDNQDAIFTVLTQSPCANGTCMLASKATNEHTFKCSSKIRNKEISESKWSEVDKSIAAQEILDINLPEVIKEAFLVVGDLEKKSSWKFPHHEIKEGKLLVSKEGVYSAFAALKSTMEDTKFSNEEKLEASEHLLKHYKEMEETKIIEGVPEDLLSMITSLKDTISKEAENENNNDNKNEHDNEEGKSGDGSTPNTQNAEGSTQTAEGDGKEPDTITFEQVLSFITATEASDSSVSQLLRLHQVVEQRVNTILN